ncbi:LURP-one-related family protein [Clostridiales bacterium FE2011]|nr:LURP-one-related family protein [Clostridiales bacterium FE2011]QTE75349.1 LURP-one-related family protein [Clostridiales bacterium FE2010]
MGVFSKYHRFREAGEEANINNVQRFGEPTVSLFTTTKVFTLHHHIDITNSREEVVYEANTKFPSIHDKTDITDAEGRFVAHIERKLLTLHQRHFITMGDGTKFEISNELFHLVKDIMNIEGLGWQIRGNIAGLNFELYDEHDEIIAVIGQKMFSIHDKYCIDIYRTEYQDTIVAVLVTLQHMIKDREAASVHSSAGGSSSSGN